MKRVPLKSSFYYCAYDNSIALLMLFSEKNSGNKRFCIKKLQVFLWFILNKGHAQTNKLLIKYYTKVRVETKSSFYAF